MSSDLVGWIAAGFLAIGVLCWIASIFLAGADEDDQYRLEAMMSLVLFRHGWCWIRHGGSHLWMRPTWGLDGAVLCCSDCGHMRVVTYDTTARVR